MLQTHRLIANPTHGTRGKLLTNLFHVGETTRACLSAHAAWFQHEAASIAVAHPVEPSRQAGTRTTDTEELEALRRLVRLAALVCILAATLSICAFFLALGRVGGTDIAHIYGEMSPAVASIRVPSAGDSGSGVVFGADGYVLTNYHVINQAQHDQDIVVHLPGAGQVPATLVGYDVATDLAVLQVTVPRNRLSVATFGDSSAVRAGDVAIAIGNPRGLSHTLTVGHVSFVGRRLKSNDPHSPDIEGVLQTDADINPGNSGGPLVNTRGQVIGINSRIESPVPGSVGLGFAIPSNTALHVAREIVARGFVRRPFLGASGWPIDTVLAKDLDLPVEQGLLVREVYPDSPAEYVGLDAGAGVVETVYGQVNAGADIILKVDGQPIRNQQDLNRMVADHAIGDGVTLEILRNNRLVTLAATLTQRPQGGPLGDYERMPITDN